MTTAINTTPIDVSRPVARRFYDGLVAFFTAISQASAAARCAEEAERLFEMSDAELAKRGLTRDGIIQHAFRGYLHL